MSSQYAILVQSGFTQIFFLHIFFLFFSTFSFFTSGNMSIMTIKHVCGKSHQSPVWLGVVLVLVAILHKYQSSKQIYLNCQSQKKLGWIQIVQRSNTHKWKLKQKIITQWSKTGNHLNPAPYQSRSKTDAHKSARNIRWEYFILIRCSLIKILISQTLNNISAKDMHQLPTCKALSPTCVIQLHTTSKEDLLTVACCQFLASPL